MLKTIPIRILGHNADIPSSLCPKDFPDFVRLFSEAEIYVFTIKRPYGDGYNTAMLLGLAVVSVPNPSSPIVDGHNGLIAETPKEMLEKITLLQKPPELRTYLGRNAQTTIAEKFNQKNFLDSWRQIFCSNALHQRKP